jgi:hypothetical protein
VTEGTTCDFGGLPGVCTVGTCEDAMLCAGVDCDDTNPCTDETCDPMDGACDYTNVAGSMPCDFGGLPGLCNAGTCEDAMLCDGVDCDDANPCTDETCDAMDGACDYTNVTEGTSCDFGGLPGVCTVGTCEDAMLCAGVNCDDGNACTTDTCDPMDGACDYANLTNGTSCDFGGLPGLCNAGACQGLCTGVDCDDSNDCTDDSCDPLDGLCDNPAAADGTACDFGGSPGLCSAGTCQDAPCITNTVCASCPSANDASCICAPSEICVPSGCTETVGGAAIMTCWPGPGESCATVADCPAEYDCVPVGFGQNQCVKTTPGCNTTNDCGLGFSCEGVPGACVDRRVPCNDYTDCPKGHVCENLPNSQFCVRVNRDCDQDTDCADIGAPWCADIDGDGSTECAGSPLPNNVPPAPACLNSGCGGSTPVCEVAAASNLATCGEYGLCQNGADCASGFECVGLWPDGRMECVELGGTCNYVTDCPEQQVCASPRTGGPPSCQAGYQP